MQASIFLKQFLFECCWKYYKSIDFFSYKIFLSKHANKHNLESSFIIMITKKPNIKNGNFIKTHTHKFKHTQKLQNKRKQKKKQTENIWTMKIWMEHGHLCWFIIFLQNVHYRLKVKLNLKTRTSGLISK